MALDPAASELLRAVGYTIASHVMARASLSRGTGRYEEPLTADVADLFTLFDPYADFFNVRRSRSKLAIHVLDFSKSQESKTGADFVLVVRGSVGRPRTTFRKLILVQAKRESWGQGIYAASNNQIAKATTMASLVGLQDSFFAYYHSNAILPLPNPWPAAPSFLYASPSRYGNQHFFRAGTLYRTIPEGFLENSAYRRHLLGMSRTLGLPAGYEWGIGFLGASYFIDQHGSTRNTSLPPLSLVLKTGMCFGEFLVELAECREGTQRSEAALSSLLRRLQGGAIGDGDGAFDPMFALAFDFASGGPDDADDVPDLDREFWERFEGIRRVPWGPEPRDG